MADADVVVVGAGAAGVAATLIAAGSGLRVALVDAGDEPAGQYYRGSHDPSWRERISALQAHEVAGRVLLAPATVVYAAERSGDAITVRTRGDDRHADRIDRLEARALVIATGAHDRPLPVPGWDLPGVITPGAAQALVKGSGTLPGRALVVAGTGPFLPAVASTVLEAGGHVVAVVEAASATHLARQGWRLRSGIERSGDALRFAQTMARARVPYVTGARIRRIHGRMHGTSGVTGVTVVDVDADWRAVAGTERTLACDTVALGFGFSPQLDIAGQLGCAMAPAASGDPVIVVDEDQRTSEPGVLAAGEPTGVGGVHLAAYEGVVAGATVARMLGADPALSAGSEAHARGRVKALRQFAAGLARAFPVRSGWLADLDDDTLVCRCEEVPVGRIRDAMSVLGATDARSVKLLTRAGMGWCQGRICEPTVAALCPAAPAAASPRPVIAPVPLGALAREAEA